MPQPLDRLLAELDQLLADLDTAVAAHADVIDAVADVHRRGAVNLVRYSELRRHDRRGLQNDLMDLGATSLATSEADVRSKVVAARNVLRALRGDAGPWPLQAINEALDEGDQILSDNSDAIFGSMRPGRSTRIMVTLPSDAADDPDVVSALMDAGMDVARVNCAHDGPAAWARMAENVRAASAVSGRAAGVSMDLPGPKLRTGPILDGPAVGRSRVTRSESGEVVAPSRIWFTSAQDPSPPPATFPPARRPTLPVQVDPTWLAARVLGDVITLRDARGRRRSFTVTDRGPLGALCEGAKNAYIREAEELWCNGTMTTAGGITPLSRTIALAVGDPLILVHSPAPVQPPAAGEVARIGCTLPEASAALRPGEHVLFDDGKIDTVVDAVTSSEATLRVVRTKPGGQHLAAEKGINMPDTTVPVTALTPDDERLLPLVAAHADIVAASFIRSAADVTHLLDRLDAAGGLELAVILKIETREGFENLPDILLAAMRHRRIAVMIARGDLAVEIGFQRLAEVPRQILALCEAAHVPAIWATQVLETLAKTGQPSRAEITDAAISQRAECVMLNKGPHIVEAILALDDILDRMDQAQTKSRALMRHIHSWDNR
ncbi:MAG TPA: pyruvate kinase [Ornithinibacter sp.]|nr:pyruvate kinase [Ornithinibacter sp.]